MSGTPVINRLFSNIILGLSQLSSEFRPSQINMINPRTVKSIFTGNGNANKAKMIVHARRLYKFKPMSKLDTETLADAIGILYCCYMFSRVEGDEKVKGIMRLR